MFETQVVIPSPEEVVSKLPLCAASRHIKEERVEQIKSVLDEQTEKLLILVGPCSAHDPAPVLEYVRRLGKLQECVQDRLVLVPRIYTDKPRSKGVGYMGMFFQPDPEHGEDIAHGIFASRMMHLRAMEESGLAAADELCPENFAYLQDLLAYYAVGARSCENQQHRFVASGVEIPVGIKNPMSGSVPALLNSVYAAQNPQVFKLQNVQVKTEGNLYAHSILRGSVDHNGHDVPNYDAKTLRQVFEGYADAERDLKHPAVMVDVNHSNSGKQYKEQIRIVKEVLSTRRADVALKRFIKGFMIESFLEEGCQKHSEVFGKSITDPCLGWEDTERLIFEIAENV